MLRRIERGPGSALLYLLPDCSARHRQEPPGPRTPKHRPTEGCIRAFHPLRPGRLRIACETPAWMSRNQPKRLLQLIHHVPEQRQPLQVRRLFGLCLQAEPKGRTQVFENEPGEDFLGIRRKPGVVFFVVELGREYFHLQLGF